jgi:hypothetical protein
MPCPPRLGRQQRLQHNAWQYHPRGRKSMHDYAGTTHRARHCAGRRVSPLRVFTGQAASPASATRICSRPVNYSDFCIVESTSAGAKFVPISPGMATCQDCSENCSTPPTDGIATRLFTAPTAGRVSPLCKTSPMIAREPGHPASVYRGDSALSSFWKPPVAAGAL